MDGDLGLERGAQARQGVRVAPVDGAPIGRLLAATDVLAQRWAIALILARPLERIGEVPLEDLAHDGPALVEWIVRALQSDDELGRLGAVAGEPGPPGLVRMLGLLSTAGGDWVAVDAVEALREVVWKACSEVLGGPSFASHPATVAVAVADRLAFVCSRALAAALATQPAPAQGAGGEPPGARMAPMAAASGSRMASMPAASASRVVIVDEHEDAPAAGAGVPLSLQGASAGGRAGSAQPRPRPWDTPLARAEGRSAGSAVLDPIDAEGAPVMRVLRGTGADSGDCA